MFGDNVQRAEAKGNTSSPCTTSRRPAASRMRPGCLRDVTSFDLNRRGRIETVLPFPTSGGHAMPQVEIHFEGVHALALHEESIGIFDALGDPEGRANTLWSIAQIAIGRPQWKLAFDHLEGRDVRDLLLRRCATGCGEMRAFRELKPTAISQGRSATLGDRRLSKACELPRDASGVGRVSQVRGLPRAGAPFAIFMGRGSRGCRGV